jgi:hypothetical protein
MRAQSLEWESSLAAGGAGMEPGVGDVTGEVCSEPGAWGVVGGASTEPGTGDVTDGAGSEPGAGDVTCDADTESGADNMTGDVGTESGGSDSFEIAQDDYDRYPARLFEINQQRSVAKEPDCQRSESFVTQISSEVVWQRRNIFIVWTNNVRQGTWSAGLGMVVGPVSK